MPESSYLDDTKGPYIVWVYHYTKNWTPYSFATEQETIDFIMHDDRSDGVARCITVRMKLSMVVVDGVGHREVRPLDR